jgi:hypothetical protein
MANSVWQYEQPRCPDGWNEAERRFYNRLIQVLDDIYSKYGRLDEKMLARSVVKRIDNSTATALEKMVTDIISAGRIAADSVEATFANVVSLSAKYGDFDFETVKNLVADAMVLEKGQADYVHITNLAATYAQAVNATIGNLVIQSSDGKYYQLDVDTDGKVSATEAELTDNEIAAGETSSGKVIVGTHITAEALGTQTLAATQALLNMIDAARINVDTLVAREEFVQSLTANEAFIHSLVANNAFIETLGTANIVGDESLVLIAQRASKNFSQEDMPLYGVKPGDTWSVPSTGKTYRAEDASKYGLRFYMLPDGSIEYALDVEDGSISIEMQGYDLVTSGIALQVGSDGQFTTPVRWVGAFSEEEFQHYVRVAPDGLHVGAQTDEVTTGEVKIDHDSVDIMANGMVFSSFGPDYVEFGNYQLRKTADGGLAFKMR